MATNPAELLSPYRPCQDFSVIGETPQTRQYAAQRCPLAKYDATIRRFSSSLYRFAISLLYFRQSSGKSE